MRGKLGHAVFRVGVSVSVNDQQAILFTWQTDQRLGALTPPSANFSLIPRRFRAPAIDQYRTFVRFAEWQAVTVFALFPLGTAWKDKISGLGVSQRRFAVVRDWSDHGPLAFFCVRADDSGSLGG
jgi:hypothetical protein